MGNLLSDYLEELEELQHQESEALILVLFSLRGAAINGNIVDFVRVWEQVEVLKESLEQSKDVLQAAKAANRRGKKVI